MGTFSWEKRKHGQQNMHHLNEMLWQKKYHDLKYKSGHHITEIQKFKSSSNLKYASFNKVSAIRAQTV